MGELYEQSPQLEGKKIVHYTGVDPQKRSNAAVLIGAFAVSNSLNLVIPILRKTILATGDYSGYTYRNCFTHTMEKCWIGCDMLVVGIR